MKNVRITTKLNAPSAPGRISDHRLSISPSCLTIRNIGMMPGANSSVNSTISSTGRPNSTGREVA